MSAVSEADRMLIRELYSVSQYDDRPAVDDICEVAQGIETFVADRGGVLRVQGRDLVRVILQYIAARHRIPYSLLRSTRTVRRPKNWLRSHESAWLAWFEDSFPHREWETEVIYPVFGMDTRSWEAVIPTWREELLAFLPTWMDRTFDPIEEPLDDEDDSVY